MMIRLISLLLSLCISIFAGSLSVKEEAQHKLPPVVYSLDIPKVVKNSQNVEFRWSVMGYHDSYKMQVLICKNNNCSNRSNIVANSGVLEPYKTGGGAYNYKGFRSKEFFYKTNLQISNIEKNQDLIVRFYYVAVNDSFLDEDTPFTSCLVPGGLGYDADNSGRKIKIRGIVDNVNNFLDLPYSGTYQVTQGNHGSVSHYNHGSWDNTYAIDFSLPKNTSVLAPIDGKVVCIYDENHKGGKECGYKPNYGCIGGGRVLVLKSANGSYLTFLHLSSIPKEVGENVSRGEVIAYSGDSKGVSSNGGRCLDDAKSNFNYHLHFHIWNHIGTPDSHTKPFDYNNRIRVKLNGNIEYLYGSQLDSSKIYGKYFESLQ